MMVLQIVQAFPELVLACALRVLLLSILCALALWLLRVRNSAIKYAAWRLILLAMLASPLLLYVVPALQLPRFPAIQSPVLRQRIVLSPGRSQSISQVPPHRTPNFSTGSVFQLRRLDHELGGNWAGFLFLGRCHPDRPNFSWMAIDAGRRPAHGKPGRFAPPRTGEPAM